MKSSSKDGNKPGENQQAQEAGAQSRQQQQSGEGKGCEGKEYGEGNYKAARQYNEGLKEHVQHHDIEKEARDAAPRSKEEEREMEDAERVARARARGAKESPDEAGNDNDVSR